MSKSKRLMELILAVNRKRTFTVKELAREFGVSSRTILRDLQELSELGVPLYSEVGPHGGYRLLRERLLPPIAFAEGEAVAIFFAIHALRHYVSLPFEAESASALNKFYSFLPADVRERIDAMKNRVDFVTPARKPEAPSLPLLLDAAIRQQVVRIEYESRGSSSCRYIQPIGVYANRGLWYCPAYCFGRKGLRLFRCDRIVSAALPSDGPEPVDLSGIALGDRDSIHRDEGEQFAFHAELSREGVERCEAELWLSSKLRVREDGTGWLEGDLPGGDLPFFASYMIGLGRETTVKRPPELIGEMKRQLAELLAKYG